MDTLDPKNYHLPYTKFLEVADTLKRNKATALTDLDTFKSHPERFSRNLETGTLEYDAALSLTMDWAMQERRDVNGDFHKLLKKIPKEQRLDKYNVRAQVETNSETIAIAEAKLKHFFADADNFLNLRRQQFPDAAKLAAFHIDMPKQLDDIDKLSKLIPESCIRNCETLLGLLLTPFPPEKQLDDQMTYSTRQALTVERKDRTRNMLNLGQR